MAQRKLGVSDRWKKLAQTKSWPDIFEATVASHLDRTALIFCETGETFTYREYGEKVQKFAKALHALGVRKGTHVGIWMTNRPEWCFLRWAIYMLGAIMIPLHTRYKTEELRYVLKQSDTEVLILEEKFIGKIDAFRMLLELIPELAEQKPGKVHSEEFPCLRTLVCIGEGQFPGTYRLEEIIALGASVNLQDLGDRPATGDVVHIIYTSGTTGFPKGVETPSTCNIGFCAISAELYDMRGDSIYLNLMPFFGNIGLSSLVFPLFDGGTLVVGRAQYDAEDTLKTIHNYRISHAIFVPTMLIDVLNTPNLSKYDLSSLRRITCSGAPVPQALIKATKEKIGVALMNVYGLSEASGLSTWVPYGDTQEHVEKSVGLAMPHCKVGILDPGTRRPCEPGVEGEICTREAFPGSQHMKGYYKKPDLTSEVIRDGWLHSGDLGKMDEEGYVYLTGRLKEMFTVGGFNVAPPEIENFLLRHPKIVNAAVVGLPDERLGEVPAAYVITKPGESLSVEDVQKYCKGNISDLKIPRYVFFVDSFPLTPQGKVQKFKLKEEGRNRIQHRM